MPKSKRSARSRKRNRPGNAGRSARHGELCPCCVARRESAVIGQMLACLIQDREDPHRIRAGLGVAGLGGAALWASLRAALSSFALELMGEGRLTEMVGLLMPEASPYEGEPRRWSITDVLVDPVEEAYDGVMHLCVENGFTVDSEGAFATTSIEVSWFGVDSFTLRLSAMAPALRSELAGTGLEPLAHQRPLTAGTVAMEIAAPFALAAIEPPSGAFEDWLDDQPFLISALLELAAKFDAVAPIRSQVPGLPKLGEVAASMHPNASIPRLRVEQTTRQALATAQTDLARSEHSRRGLQDALNTERQTAELLRSKLSRHSSSSCKTPLPSEPRPVRAPPTANSDPERIDALEAALATARLIAAQRDEELSAARREIYEQEQQIQGLHLAARAVAGLEASSTGASVPESFDVLTSWCHSQLGDRIHVPARAIEQAQASSYVNPGKVYRALEALAELYWPMVYAPSEGARKAWEARMGELGVTCSPVGRACTQARTRGYYSLVVDGQAHVLDLHLRGNSSFDPRYGLRIYFTRDDANRRLIVGSFPEHLPNHQSN